MSSLSLGELAQIAVTTWWRYTWRATTRNATNVLLSAVALLIWLYVNARTVQSLRDLSGLAAPVLTLGSLATAAMLWQSILVVRSHVFNVACGAHHAKIVRVYRDQVLQTTLTAWTAWTIVWALAWRAALISAAFHLVLFPFGAVQPFIHDALTVPALHSMGNSVFLGVALGVTSNILATMWLLRQSFGRTTLRVV